MSRDRRVVITGLGIVTPLGVGIEPLWTGLLDKRCAVRRITAFDAGEFKAQVAGEIDRLRLADFVPKSYRKSSKVMARDIEIAVACAYAAATDAGLRTKCIVERGEADGEPTHDPARFGHERAERFGCGHGLLALDDDRDGQNVRHRSYLPSERIEQDSTGEFPCLHAIGMRRRF